MRKFNSYFSLWHTLLFVSFSIMGYLVTTHISEAMSFSSAVTYFKQRSADISWSPSRGTVGYYVLKITDTNYLSQKSNRSVLTTVKEVQSISPSYQLACKNNHSYQVSVKAVSYNGFSSEFSAPSILFICDQQRPEVILDPLPSLTNLTSPNIAITGSYKELNLDSIIINGFSATVNPFTMTFSRNISLTPGTNRVTLAAKDLAGNISRTEFEINYAPASTAFLDSNEKYHPFAFDYNNDGKMDLLLGGEDGKVAVLMNRGLQDAPLLSGLRILKATDGKEIDIGSRAVPVMADLNDDGLMDLLLGSGDGYVYFCKNQGSQEDPLFASPVSLGDVMGIPMAVESNSSPCVVDWDDDTKRDILLGSGDGGIVLYLNEATNKDKLIFSSPKPLQVDGLSIKVEKNSIPFIADWDSDGGKDLLIGDDEGYLHLYLNSVVNGEPDLMGGEQVDREEHAQALEKDLAIPYFIGINMLLTL